MSCYTLPQRNQYCSDSYMLVNDEMSVDETFENKDYLKYLSCVDVKNVCGERTIIMNATQAQTGITKSVLTMPDIKNCIWVVKFQEDRNEAQIFKDLRPVSPLRIEVSQILGLDFYVFQEEEIFLQANQQNITDDDDPQFDIPWEQFRQGEQYYILALKKYNSTTTDFQVKFSINLVQLQEFQWVNSQADEAQLYFASIVLVILSVYAAVIANKSREHRLRKASSKLQTKKVKKPRSKKGRKIKRSLFQNPYLNLPNQPGNGGNNGDQPGEGSSKQKSSIKLNESMFDQSGELRDLLSRGGLSLRNQLEKSEQKIQDSFFSSENNKSKSSDSDGSSSSQENNLDKRNSSSNNTSHVQGNNKKVKRIDSNKNSGSGTQSGYSSLQRMQSVKFKENVDTKKRRRNNNYMDNTADLTANDIQWMNDTQVRDLQGADVLSQTQGSPPQKGGQLIEVDSQYRIRKKSPHAMTYKDLYQSQRNNLLAQSARRKQQNSSYQQHRNSTPSQLSSKSGKIPQRTNAIAQIANSYIQSSRDRNNQMLQHQSQGSLSNMSYKSQIQQQMLKSSFVKQVKKKPSPLKFQGQSNRNSQKSLGPSTFRSKKNGSTPPIIKGSERISNLDGQSITRNLSPQKYNNTQNMRNVLSPSSRQGQTQNRRKQFISNQKRSKSQQFTHDADGNLEEVVRNVDADNSLIEEFKFGNEEQYSSSVYTSQQHSSNIQAQSSSTGNNQLLFGRNFRVSVGNLSSSRDQSKQRQQESNIENGVPDATKGKKQTEELLEIDSQKYRDNLQSKQKSSDSKSSRTNNSNSRSFRSRR
eukprot:403370229